MIEILTKIRVKITIIVVENRELYYFIIISKCKEVPLSLFSYQMLASTLTMDEQSIYYNVYGAYLYTSYKKAEYGEEVWGQTSSKKIQSGEINGESDAISLFGGKGFTISAYH